MGNNALLTAKYIGNRTLVKELYSDVSGELIVITHQHSKVHEGKFFTSGHYVTGVLAGGTLDLLLLTPATKTMHTHIKLAASADSTFAVYEDTVVSAVGTSVSIFNNNRSSVNVAEALCSHTPTITNVGTQLDGLEYVPGGDTGNRVGTLQDVGSEQLVLASNKQYLLRLTNISVGTAILNIRLGFYEV